MGRALRCHCYALFITWSNTKVCRSLIGNLFMPCKFVDYAGVLMGLVSVVFDFPINLVHPLQVVMLIFLSDLFSTSRHGRRRPLTFRRFTLQAPPQPRSSLQAHTSLVLGTCGMSPTKHGPSLWMTLARSPLPTFPRSRRHFRRKWQNIGAEATATPAPFPRQV